MDDRVHKHARILTDWCTNIEKDDNVIISTGEEAKPLLIALQEEIGKREANPVTLYRSSEASRRFLKHSGDFQTPDHLLSLMEQADVFIRIASDPNLKAMSDVSGETMTDFMKAMKPILETRLSKRWCGTQHPTNARAQLAGMSLQEYEDFVYNAIIRDWREVHDRQEILRKELDQASTLTVEGPDTDIEMNIDGMVAVNSDGKKNLPSGEVFTAPIPDSVEGSVLFDKPLMHRGKEIQNVHLTFREGTVTDFSAEQNEEVLEDLLATDEGAKRLGEIGIGTNRKIDRFTRNMLFDEKMGETIHMALGRAYDENVGKNREQNQSAIHVDMIKDMSEGTILADGTVLMENGRFPWDE